MSEGNERDNKATVKPYESELRQDIVTGDWVVIATGRAKRPDAFASVERIHDDMGMAGCPFCHPEETGQEDDVLVYRKEDGDVSLRVFPNKYPAFSRGRAVRQIPGTGPYFSMNGVGYHELVVMSDHNQPLALLQTWQIAEVLDAYQERYLALMNKKSVNYIQIIHNHGKEAGASIAHPHSQLMAIPVVSPYVALELTGAEQYYRSHHEKVYGVVVGYEMEKRERIVAENDDFIALCPFASRDAFEVWIIGKRPNPYFERITEEEKLSVADILRKTLLAIHTGLNDPPYNFYLHTAPCDGKDYPHYQWHIEVLPKTATWGGFELSTGIEVSLVQPEKAAEFLRSVVE